MSKRDTMTIVSDRLGLYFGYVIEAATYFPGFQEAFEWLYLSGEITSDPESRRVAKKNGLH